MTNIAIRTQNLSKHYVKLRAVDNVTIEIPQGEIVGLVGKNGAGKTTLIRMLAGLTLPDSGTFQLLPDTERNATSVAAIVESPGVYPNMSAINNLTTQSLLLGIQPDDSYLARTLQLVGLSATNTSPVKNYSLGMRQRLAIAMTLVGKPKLLLLDEPTNGLDPQGIREIRETLVALNEEMGVTILVSSHILPELSKFATMYMFMDKGKILRTVHAEELGEFSKRYKLKVDNVLKACNLLDPLGKAVITAQDVVEFVDTNNNVPATQLILTLAQNGVNVINMAIREENLEDYFLQVVQQANALTTATTSNTYSNSTQQSGTTERKGDNNE